MTDTAPHADQQLRDRIAAAFKREDDRHWACDHGFSAGPGQCPEAGGFVDAVLALVLPEVDRIRAELAQEQHVSQERGRYLAEVDTALIAAGEDEGGGYIAYARRIAQLAADRDRARAELAQARQQIADDPEPVQVRWGGEEAWVQAGEDGIVHVVPLTLPGGNPAVLTLEGDAPEILAGLLSLGDLPVEFDDEPAPGEVPALPDGFTRAAR